MRTVHLVLLTTILFCRFLKIMELIIQEPGSSFKAFIPTIISICMEQIYPIIAEASIEPTHTYTNINTHTHTHMITISIRFTPSLQRRVDIGPTHTNIHTNINTHTHHRRGEYTSDAYIHTYISICMDQIYSIVAEASTKRTYTHTLIYIQIYTCI